MMGRVFNKNLLNPSFNQWEKFTKFTKFPFSEFPFSDILTVNVL